MTVWIAILAGAVLAALYELRGAAQERPDGLASAAKTAATGCLALAGFMAGAPWLVTLGLALGAAGDFFLTRSGQRSFLAGMAAFAAGHLAYAVWMFTPEHATRLVFFGPLLLILGTSTEWWLLPKTGALAGAVRGYVWIIVAMAAAAVTLPLIAWPAMLGAALFVASDMMLATALFVTRKPGLRRVLSLLLWPLYWGGQALILLGALGRLSA